LSGIISERAGCSARLSRNLNAVLEMSKTRSFGYGTSLEREVIELDFRDLFPERASDWRWVRRIVAKSAGLGAIRNWVERGEKGLKMWRNWRRSRIRMWGIVRFWDGSEWNDRARKRLLLSYPQEPTLKKGQEW
jgi:hypothetical protein